MISSPVLVERFILLCPYLGDSTISGCNITSYCNIVYEWYFTVICCFLIVYFVFSTEGEWVACDEVLLGFELFHGSYQWDQKPNFNINQRSTGNVTISLGIKVQGEVSIDSV